MGKGSRQAATERQTQSRADRRTADLAYREALGISAGDKLPRQIGTGTPAGGTGVHRGRNQKAKPQGWRGRYTPDVKVTSEQIRAVTCPRCLAAPAAPCRNQTGGVSAGHAARRALAQRTEVKRLRRHRRDAEPTLSREEHEQLVAQQQRHRQQRTPQVDSATGKRVVSAAAAVTRDHTTRRPKSTNPQQP